MSDCEQVVGGEREGMAREGLGGPQGAKLARLCRCESETQKLRSNARGFSSNRSCLCPKDKAIPGHCSLQGRTQRRLCALLPGRPSSHGCPRVQLASDLLSCFLTPALDPLGTLSSFP